MNSEPELKPNVSPKDDSKATPTIPEQLVLQWCSPHWSQLMYALQDRDLGDQTAPNREAVHEKQRAGKGDPCFEATTIINIAGLQFFTAQKLLTHSEGYPVCAFSGIINHVADVMALKYKPKQAN